MNSNSSLGFFSDNFISDEIKEIKGKQSIIEEEIIDYIIKSKTRSEINVKSKEILNFIKFFCKFFYEI